MLDKGVEESIGVKAGGGGGGTKRASHHLGHHGLGDLGIDSRADVLEKNVINVV